eukprot:6478189-Pyramimonas_sp.AAC.1
MAENHSRGSSIAAVASVSADVLGSTQGTFTSRGSGSKDFPSMVFSWAWMFPGYWPYWPMAASF